MPDLRTALYDDHVALGGRMVPFAGWEMPVQYDSVIAESRAVREAAGMFDVSHMARLTFLGETTLEFLEWITSNDVAKLKDGTGQYSLLPNEIGGSVDDIIVYRFGPTEYRMVVNASNHQKDWDWMSAQNRFGVAMSDQTRETVMIAVQGPKAVEKLQGLFMGADLAAPKPFGVVQGTLAGVPVWGARSGYTGEDGYEIIADAEDGSKVWRALAAAGVKPCGLGARDVLRVEAGLPLYGHELADDLSPIAAGLGWVVGKTKTFIGSEPINAARRDGTPSKLVGVRLASKRLTMPGMEVFVEGKAVGKVSSGVFSPLLDAGVAFAFVDSAIEFETPCTIEIRGKHEPGTIVNKRFFRRA